MTKSCILYRTVLPEWPPQAILQTRRVMNHSMVHFRKAGFTFKNI
ncbi:MULTISPECIES: hypothetical protein [Oligella]|nr:MULTISPECIES: hypothetical protein [Oligella]MDK6202854.1 hypothetical protein [Oligella urethralis]